MTADFKPALGASHSFSVERAASQEDSTASSSTSDDVLLLSFSVRPHDPNGFTYQVWTNLPSDDLASWDGSHWREVTLLQDAASSVGPSLESAQDWPLLSISDATTALIATRPLLRATLSIQLKDVQTLLPSSFEYTYRRMHADGQVEWLGGAGDNGRIEMAIDETEGLAGWKRLAQRSFGDSQDEDVSRVWGGEEGALDYSVGPGAEWAGFGIFWNDGIPTALLLPTSRDLPLSPVFIHPEPTNPPLFHLSTSHAEPNETHLLATYNASIACEEHTEGSFFDLGAIRKDLVLKSTSAIVDHPARAALTPLSALKESDVDDQETVVPLKTSNSSIVALYHQTRLILYSPGVTLAGPLAVKAPKCLRTPIVVHLDKRSAVLLHPDQGMLVGLSGDLRVDALDVCAVTAIKDKTGQPTDVLFGLVNTSAVPESTHPFIAPPAPEILISSTPLQDRTDSQTTHVNQSTDVGLSSSSSEEEEGVGHGRDASDETDDTIVNPLEDDDDDEGRHDTLKLVAEEVGVLDETALDDNDEEAYAEMEAGGTKGFLDVLWDVLWNFWQGILDVFGCASTEEKETGQPSERTPLLAEPTPTPVPVQTAASASSSTYPPGHSTFHLAFPSQAFISVPSLSHFPTSFRLVARPAGSDAAFQAVIYEGGQVKEVSRGKRERVWMVALGVENDERGGEWEMKAWVDSP